jgi:hypothetical protein
MQVTDEQTQITLEEATELVNSLVFPAAVLGDKVRQFNYWFELTEGGWVPTEPPNL